MRDGVGGLLALGLPTFGLCCDLALLGRADAALPPNPVRAPLPWMCGVSEPSLDFEEEEDAFSLSELFAFTSP